MKSIIVLIALVTASIAGQWQKPTSNLVTIKAALKSRTATPDMVQATDAYGYTPLITAAYRCDKTALRALLVPGVLTANDVAQVNDFQESALLWASCNNDIEAVRLLLGTGHYDTKMLNQADQDGNTALMYAANNNRPDIAKLIIDAGKLTTDDLDRRNANNESAISYAKKSGGALAVLLESAREQAHKRTLTQLVILQADMPVLKRGQ